jgi:hypothetical protein
MLVFSCSNLLMANRHFEELCLNVFHTIPTSLTCSHARAMEKSITENRIFCGTSRHSTGATYAAKPTAQPTATLTAAQPLHPPLRHWEGRQDEEPYGSLTRDSRSPRPVTPVHSHEWTFIDSAPQSVAGEPAYFLYYGARRRATGSLRT